MNGDWLWFCARPARAYRARLATRAEIDALTAQAAIDPALLTGARFVYVIVRYNRGGNSLQKIFAALEPLRDLSEDECRRAWFEADQLIDARIERLAQ
jgi:hypothetical protein